MKIQLKDSEEIIEVSSAKGAEMIEAGEGEAVPVHEEGTEIEDTESDEDDNEDAAE